MLNLHFYFFFAEVSTKSTHVLANRKMKNSEIDTLQQYSSVVDIIADEHSDQSRVSYSKQLCPIPTIPDPQMHPYWVIKRYDNISKWHDCETKFDK